LPANDRIVVDRAASFRRDRARTFDFVMMRRDIGDMVDAPFTKRDNTSFTSLRHQAFTRHADVKTILARFACVWQRCGRD
jgi:hypothetical protein